MFNEFKSIHESRKVISNITTEKFLYELKTGEQYSNQIIQARELYKTDVEQYKAFKATHLPCYSLNFNFHKFRSNNSINEPTGYIYIDLDNQLEIDLDNPYLYASWISLSETGRGILVKVDNLNLENFSDTYASISKLLNIQSDSGAKKATQINVLSYDPDLYVNEKAKTYKAIQTGAHYSLKLNKDTIETVVDPYMGNLRFDNLDELIENIEFNGEVIYDFESKFKYANVYIPHTGYEEGKRNNGLCGYGTQMRALNPNITHSKLLGILHKANKHYCKPPLPYADIKNITGHIMKIRNQVPLDNKERRFIFNPDYNLNSYERRSASIKKLNKCKIEKSKLKIQEAINNWDFELYGKITRNKIPSITGQDIKTVKKYYALFKSEIELLNKKYVGN